jgi:hypothetical protein
MRLEAELHPIARDVVQVIDLDVPRERGRCVGRANLAHRLVWRTSGSPSPATLRDVRAALEAAGYGRDFRRA